MSRQPDNRPPADSVQRQHELRDLSTRSLMMGLVALATLIGVAMWLMIVLFDVLETRSVVNDEQSPLVETGVLPPQPRLETTRGSVRSQLDALEAVQLTTYRWVDRQEGIARVPVERAMELLAARGLPYRGAEPSVSAAKAESR